MLRSHRQTVRARSTGFVTARHSCWGYPTIVALLVVVAAPSIASAQTWDPFPELGNEQVGVHPPLDGPRYKELKECLVGFDSKVGATYWAGVVNISDEKGREGPSYSDAVPWVDAWYEHLEQTRPRLLDPEKHVLIGMSLKNRGIAIHPGHGLVELGFKRFVIKNTIDASSFGDKARAGDFGGAICALAQAVDDKLLSLERQRKTSLAALKKELEEDEARRTELGSQIERALAKEHIDKKLAGSLGDRLNCAGDSLDIAQRARKRGALASAREARWSATGSMDEVETALTNADKTHSHVERQRSLVAAMRRGVDRRDDRDWALPKQAVEQLDACERKLDRAEAEGRRGRLAEPTCSVDARWTLQQADTRYFIVTRVLPMSGGTGTLIIIFVVLVIQAVRRRRGDKQCREHIAAWEDKLGHAAERLLELENRFPLFFGDVSKRWVGRSQRLDQRAADAVNLTYLLYDRATTLLGEAKALHDRGNLVRIRPFSSCVEKLTTAAVEIETGEADKSRKVFAPLQRSYTGTATSLLGDLESSYAEATRALEAVTTTIERGQDSLADASAALADALTEIDRRDAHALPTAHLFNVVDPRAPLVEAAREELTTDPLSATEKLDELQDTLRAVANQGKLGNDALDQIRGPITKQGTALRARVAKLRSEGFSLDEPGWNPDLVLDRGVSDARRATSSIGEGKEHSGRAVTDQLQRSLDTLSEQLDICVRAREEVPDIVARQKRDRIKLIERIPEARATLAELRQHQHPDTFATEDDNLVELKDVLGHLEKWQEHIVEDHAAERYLSAVADIETADELLDAGNTLLRQISAIEAALVAAEEQTRDMVDSAADILRTTASTMDKNRLGIDPGYRAEHARLSEEQRKLKAALSDERPHWFNLRDTLTNHHAVVSGLARDVESDLTDYRDACSLARRLSQEAAALAHAATVETRDRGAVEDTVLRARAQVEALDTVLNNPDRSGAEILLEVQGTREVLSRARSSWEKEMALVERVDALLSRVVSRYRHPPSHFGEGVVADYSSAWDEVEQARQLRNHKHWERAEEACREADDAMDAADRRASSRAASLRAARIAAEEAARAAARRRARASRSSSSSSWSSSSSSTSSFGSSSSSSSGGSSFGGSNSGGSSW